MGRVPRSLSELYRLDDSDDGEEYVPSEGVLAADRELAEREASGEEDESDDDLLSIGGDDDEDEDDEDDEDEDDFEDDEAAEE